MIVTEKRLKGLFEIELKPIGDNRGFFMRTYDSSVLIKPGLNREWVQENHSFSSKKNTIRGLHFLLPPHTDGKLIRCISGEIYDVVVDLRKESPTFGQWESVQLGESNMKCLFIPRGFAHGFCTLTDNCTILYKHDNFYNRDFDAGILWNDPQLNIEWPVKEPVISERDANLQLFSEFCTSFQGF
ncbi:MAG: dTDP-4-dehydrorhamnose 3,5-epimerase [Bacteroidales bacterium]